MKLEPQERARYVQGMFARIAARYDLMNRLMTAGQDVRWRREVIRRAAIPPEGRVLDLGAGTGDLTFEALAQQPTCQPVAGDFTLAMMRVGQQREGAGRIGWVGADALNLPVPTGSFDTVVSGFLLRNVIDIDQALGEQARVLKPGGRMVALDTTRPRPSLLSPFVRLHFRLVIPLLGRLITGQSDAYRYLPTTSENFLEAGALAERMRQAGLQEVGYTLRMFGTIAIHWGVKA